MNSFAGSARGRAAGQLGRCGVRQHDVSFFGLHFNADAVDSASARSTSTVSFIDWERRVSLFGTPSQFRTRARLERRREFLPYGSRKTRTVGKVSAALALLIA